MQTAVTIGPGRTRSRLMHQFAERYRSVASASEDRRHRNGGAGGSRTGHFRDQYPRLRRVLRAPAGISDAEGSNSRAAKHQPTETISLAGGSFTAVSVAFQQDFGARCAHADRGEPGASPTLRAGVMTLARSAVDFCERRRCMVLVARADTRDLNTMMKSRAELTGRAGFSRVLINRHHPNTRSRSIGGRAQRSAHLAQARDDVSGNPNGDDNRGRTQQHGAIRAFRHDADRTDDFWNRSFLTISYRRNL